MHEEMDGHVQTHLHLSFLEAALGCRKRVRYARQVPCEGCNGSGCKRGHSMSTCSSCKGSGKDTKIRGGFIFAKPCGSCGGSGKINTHPCTKCRGAKTTKIMEDVELEIPSGVTEDYVLQFQGKGDSIGRHSGDLIVRLTVNAPV